MFFREQSVERNIAGRTETDLRNIERKVVVVLALKSETLELAKVDSNQLSRLRDGRMYASRVGEIVGIARNRRQRVEASIELARG